ncbi:MAG: alpha/beta hydrolase family protein [Bacteroidales bacterium]|nr:alpha/beta hydrolase family protein [Bacteroidales bacterium]
MGIIRRMLSHGFDNIYLNLTNNKTCNKILEHDLFDGNPFTIDEFQNHIQEGFDKPELFYSDYDHLSKMNLREGYHFQATDMKDSEKYGYTPMVFDPPIITDFPSNNIVPFKWFHNPKQKSKVLLLFSPGWARPNLNIEKRFCNRLLKNGIDAGLLTKPYHQERTPQGSYSGEYFYSGNVFWTGMNFRQYVSEIRLIIQSLRKEYDYIGIIGMSSGGFQAALAACTEKIDFYFPFITGAQLGSIAWNGKLSKYMRADLEKKGINEEDLNKAWSIGDQLYLAKHCKAKHIKQYISKYDEIIRTEYQEKLWKAYGQPERMNLNCAHNSIIFAMNKVNKDIVEFVKERIK